MAASLILCTMRGSGLVEEPALVGHFLVQQIVAKKVLLLNIEIGGGLLLSELRFHLLRYQLLLQRLFLLVAI